MKINFMYVGIFLVSVLISSISQIVLKLSSRKKYKNKLKEYFNPMVIGAYSMFLGATLMTTLAYRGVPLSFGPILEATGYVYVAILGTTILKEKMTKNKLIGNVLIIVGIIIFAIK